MANKYIWDWDAPLYLEEVCKHNRIIRDNDFKFARVSGMASLEEVTANMSRAKAFIAIDDTAEYSDDKAGGGYFEHKMYTVFILARFKMADMKDKARVMNLCRRIKRSLQSRFILDAEELKAAMIYLDDEFPGREVSDALLNGLTGLYFSFSFGRPIDLTLKDDEWDEGIVFDKTFGVSFS